MLGGRERWKDSYTLLTPRRVAEGTVPQRGYSFETDTPRVPVRAPWGGRGRSGRLGREQPALPALPRPGSRRPAPPRPAPCHGVSVEGSGNVSPGRVPLHGSPSSRLLFRRFSWPVGSTFLGVCLRVPDLHSAGSGLLVDHPAAFLLQFVYFSVLEVSFFNIFTCILEQT